MSETNARFQFASAPDSWGVLDYPGPSWEQSYEKMLDEMVEAGYTGSELGPYGFFPTDPKILQPQLEKRKLKLLASFVPVKMTEPGRQPSRDGAHSQGRRLARSSKSSLPRDRRRSIAPSEMRFPDASTTRVVPR